MSAPVLYLLDTNTASYLLKSQSPAARDRWVLAERSSRVSISTITEAELRFGLEKKPGALRLRAAVERFCSNVEILAWDSVAARAYGVLRHQLSSAGKSLAELDLLIAAHAVSLDAVLVTRDRAFERLTNAVKVVNWATDLN